MDYEQALEWVMSFWEPARTKEQEMALRPLKVARMGSLLERLGSPHLEYPSVLVAGTKGKGSTAAFVAEGLRAAGYRVGRYTQPHLIDWRERTWVDGGFIAPDEVAALASSMRREVEALSGSMGSPGGFTTYEVGSALTLLYFAKKQVDIAVLEIGVGGRLDALNAVDPVLSVVTSISFDHTDVLGHTLGEIATEKAGIFRAGVAAVSSPQQPEAEKALRQVADEKGARLYLVGREDAICTARGGSGKAKRRAADWVWREGADPGAIDVCGPFGAIERLHVALLGDHQRDNAAVAVAALQLLEKQGFRVSADAMRRGLAQVEWPGRVQLLRENPAVVVDAAHNADSAERLAETLRKHYQGRRLILVFGASADKDVAGMARVLGPIADLVIATSSGHRRAADVERLAAEFASSRAVELEPDAVRALGRAVALASADDLVLVTGSVFLVGRAIELLK